MSLTHMSTLPQLGARMRTVDIDQSTAFYVGNFEINPDASQMSYDGKDVTLEPQVIDVMRALSGYGDALAPRSELLDNAWTDGGGTDESLTRAISLLRKAFTKIGATMPVIQTVHKRGYRLCLPVTYPAQRGLAAGLANSAESGISSIAVLAFEDRSHDQDYDHFGSGISEEILNALAQVEGFRVAARKSAFSFTGKNLDLNIISKALNVRYILEGSVRIAGQKLRVTAQLTDTDTGYLIMSETYDEMLKDIFEVQDSIAQLISRALQSKLSTKDTRIVKRLTEVPKAYELFLQGRALNQRMYGEGILDAAKKLLKRAIDLDPNFAEAYQELAHTYSLESTYAKSFDKRAKIKAAAECAQTALSLNHNLAFSITFIALEKFSQGDVVGALDLTETAYQIDPNDAEVCLRLGYFYAIIGHVKQAIPYLEKAVSLDPVQGRNLQVLAIAKLCNDEAAHAQRLARRSIDLRYAFASDVYAAATYAMGDPVSAAKHMMQTLSELVPIFGDAFNNPELWEMAARGCYGNDPAAAEFLTAGIIALLGGEKVESGEHPPEIPLLSTLVRTGAAAEFFKYVGDTPPPGSHAVILNIWAAGEPCSKFYTHPDFLVFAKRIGFAEAWDKYGLPDRLAETA